MVALLPLSHLDCKKALALNQSYVKAYVRLVAAYMKSNQPQEALSACEAGLAIEPGNEQLKASLASLVGQSSATGSAPTPSSGAAEGAGAAGGLGGLGGLSGLLNNPAIRQA